MILHNGIKCPKCLDIIYSRAVHDYHHCSCSTSKDGSADQGVSIDGGFDYMRYGWANDIKKDDIEIIELYLLQTKQELHADWNYQTNKLGVIKKDEIYFSTKEVALLEWFWSLVSDACDYKIFLTVFNDTENRNFLVEQLYCQNLYK